MIVDAVNCQSGCLGGGALDKQPSGICILCSPSSLLFPPVLPLPLPLVYLLRSKVMLLRTQ